MSESFDKERDEIEKMRWIVHSMYNVYNGKVSINWLTDMSTPPKFLICMACKNPRGADDDEKELCKCFDDYDEEKPPAVVYPVAVKVLDIAFLLAAIKDKMKNLGKTRIQRDVELRAIYGDGSSDLSEYWWLRRYPIMNTVLVTQDMEQLEYEMKEPFLCFGDPVHLEVDGQLTALSMHISGGGTIPEQVSLVYNDDVFESSGFFRGGEGLPSMSHFHPYAVITVPSFVTNDESAGDTAGDA